MWILYLRTADNLRNEELLDIHGVHPWVSIVRLAVQIKVLKRRGI